MLQKYSDFKHHPIPNQEDKSHVSVSWELKPQKTSNNKHSSGLTLSSFLPVIPKALSIVRLVTTQTKDRYLACAAGPFFLLCTPLL